MFNLVSFSQIIDNAKFIFVVSFEKIGVIFQLNQLSELTKISKDLIGNSKYWKNKIQIERKKNVFNIGNSDKMSARYINSLFYK